MTWIRGGRFRNLVSKSLPGIAVALVQRQRNGLCERWMVGWMMVGRSVGWLDVVHFGRFRRRRRIEAQGDHETVTANCSLRLILARDILRRRKKQRKGRRGRRGRKVHYVTIWRRMCSCTRNHNFCLFCLREGNYPRPCSSSSSLVRLCLTESPPLPPLWAIWQHTCTTNLDDGRT